jgi:hypothetical protein
MILWALADCTTRWVEVAQERHAVLLGLVVSVKCGIQGMHWDSGPV